MSLRKEVLVKLQLTWALPLSNCSGVHGLAAYRIHACPFLEPHRHNNAP
jgi:hypothetical protein